MNTSPATKQPEAILNEVLRHFYRDADDLVSRGLATPDRIDLAMRLGAGHRDGPFGARGAATSSEQPEGAANPIQGLTVVLGSGRMASGIVESVARAGRPVVAVTRSRDSARRMLSDVDSSLERAVARGRLDSDIAHHARILLGATDQDGVLAGAGLVIEAIAEDLAVKREVLARIDPLVSDQVPFATNTSSFTVSEVMANLSSSRPTLALHFFNPATAMRLVEVVSGPRCDAALTARAEAWVRAIGKVPVRCPDTRGFLVNRLLIPMLNDAVRVYEGGVPIEAIEAAMTEHAGHPMGPFALMDMIGIDVMVAALDALAEGQDDRLRPAATLRELLAAGRHGRKTGGGFLQEGRSA